MGDERVCSIGQSCMDHKDLESRVQKLEETIKEILSELKVKAVSDAEMRKIMEAMVKNQELMQADIKELRTSMMDLVTQTLQKSQNDMATFARLQEENQATSTKDDKSWYRKVILTCVIVGASILMTVLGVKSVAPGLIEIIPK